MRAVLNPTYTRGRAWQLVLIFTLISWFLKSEALLYVYNQHVGMPFVEHPLLRGWMLSPRFSILVYLMPILTVVSLIHPRKCWALFSAVVLIFCSLMMLWNIQSYNDATFVVSFWVGVWLLWWAGQWRSCRVEDARWAILLGFGVISFIFLGGAVGKWTGEYWSGEVVYHLYFLEKGLWGYQWLRENSTESFLRQVACWFSRMLILMETAMATVVFWPPRSAALVCVVIPVAMVLGSTWMLFSVLGPLIGLALALAWIHSQEIAKIRQNLLK